MSQEKNDLFCFKENCTNTTFSFHNCSLAGDPSSHVSVSKDEGSGWFGLLMCVPFSLKLCVTFYMSTLSTLCVLKVVCIDSIELVCNIFYVDYIELVYF
jgi:hypothetical protein